MVDAFEFNIDDIPNAVPCPYVHITTGNLRNYDTTMNGCLNSCMTKIAWSKTYTCLSTGITIKHVSLKPPIFPITRGPQKDKAVLSRMFDYVSPMVSTFPTFKVSSKSLRNPTQFQTQLTKPFPAHQQNNLMCWMIYPLKAMVFQFASCKLTSV